MGRIKKVLLDLPCSYQVKHQVTTAPLRIHNAGSLTCFNVCHISPCCPLPYLHVP